MASNTSESFARSELSGQLRYRWPLTKHPLQVLVSEKVLMSGLLLHVAASSRVASDRVPHHALLALILDQLHGFEEL